MARTAEPSREIAGPDEFDKAVRDYLHFKVRIDELKAEQDALKPVIVEFLEENVEPDDSGHRVLQFEEEIEGFRGFQRQRRVKRTVDMDTATRILTEAGLVGECIKLVPQIDEDAVFARLYTEDLTEEQIDEMFPQEITFALVPKRK